MITFFRRALPLLSPGARRRFYLACVAMMVSAAMEAAALVLIAPLMSILTAANLKPNSRIVNDLLRWLNVSSASHLAVILAFATVVLYLVKSAFAIGTFRWSMGVFLGEEAKLVKRLIASYLYAPYGEHLQSNSSERVRTITWSIRSIFQQGFVVGMGAMGDTFSVVLVGVILIIANPILAVAAGLYFGAVAVTYQRITNHYITKRAAHLNRQQAVDFRTIQQSLTAVKEIKVRGVEESFVEEVYGLRHGLISTYRTMAMITMTPRYVLELAMIGAATTVASVAYSTESVSSATATVGLFLVGGFRLLSPLNKIIFGNAQAKASMPSLEQVWSDFDTFGGFAPTEEELDATAAEEAAIPKAELLPALPNGSSNYRLNHGLPGSLLVPRIKLENVGYSYIPGTRVLEDINVIIEPGESIGVVGPSGAGKTTLVDILLGLLPPDEGTILVDGHPLTSILRRWQKMVGYVPQSIALFDDTVRANVALGVSDAEDEEVWAALRLAQLEETISQLPEGIDTMVGERGARLSGGQRQRLGVARALFRYPSVLMFDEATAALDNETEFRLTEVLESLRGTITTITIAHRLSTIRRCDRVLYLEDGHLVAQGGFLELNDQIPGFARLVSLSSLQDREEGLNLS